MAWDVSSLLGRLRRHPAYADQIVHAEVVPGASARFADVQPPLPERLATALASRGIERFWSHQAESIDLARSGFPYVVTTATASGKSLCYLAPLLEMLLLDRQARALIVFPTKALAQDQAGKLRDLGLFPDVIHALYDGDTPTAERASIRRTARLILTNPDMLHRSILPGHSQWAAFLRRLRMVVVDEAHVYRGVFGGHVALVARRLSRLAESYGASPQWVGCSATIANPEELFRRLTGIEGEIPVVSDDGAPRGRRHFVFWNPPLVMPDDGIRRSTHSEATMVFSALVGEGVRTIAFARARKSAELLLAYAREALQSTESRRELADRIASYRAGYTASQRRAIEQRLFSGELLGVTATNALELGVDIGGMDAVVMAGYPGTVASAWQQAGRAGRRHGDSLAILVASDNPLDQFLMRCPQWFFESSHENAVVDPGNRHILGAHLVCAAWESALTESDMERFGGDRALRVAKQRVETGDLAWRNDRLVPTSLTPPAAGVDIRSASSRVFTIVLADGNVLGTVEEERAYEQVHPGAVYLHMGESYMIEDMDLAGRRVRAVPCGQGIFTEPRVEGSIEILSREASKEFGTTVVYFGEVRVTKQVVGYRRRNAYTDDVVGEWDLDLPKQIFDTEAVWYPVPRALVDAMESERIDLPGTVHALEHASIALLPLFALCDRNDIGGVSTPYHPQVGAPAVFVHDAHPGGVGIAETGFRLVGPWLEATAALVGQCPCADGCPACVQSPKCGNNNEPLDKRGAAWLAKGLCEGGAR